MPGATSWALRSMFFCSSALRRVRSISCFADKSRSPQERFPALQQPITLAARIDMIVNSGPEHRMRKRATHKK